jgi:hypothetical protein
LFKPRKKSALDIEIERNVDSLYRISDPEKYDLVLAKVERLYKIRALAVTDRVSPDTWALIGANLFGIALILTHEYTNPITTKALNFAIRPTTPKT